MKSRKSPRRKEYDYTSAGGYFITICTKDRVHYFGEILDGEMLTNQLGNICIKEILDTQEYRSHIIIDEYIVMPNHIHILLIIGEKPYPDQVGTYGNTSLDKDALPRVPTETLGSIIRQIKSRVTKYANQNNITFARQGRYHDHIIRDENEYNRIKYYIQTNPQNRDTDSLQ